MDAKLTALLGRYKAYFEVQEDSRIRCLANDHCFPAKYDVIHAFINGKKFPMIKKRFDAEQSLAQFEPFIVESKNFPTMLYCTLTRQLMEKSISAAQKHIAGKKYDLNKARYDAGDMQLKPEPDLDEVMGGRPRGPKEAKGEEGDMEEDDEGEEDELEGEEEEEEEEEEEDGAGPRKRMKLDEDDVMSEEEEGAGPEEDAGAAMDESDDSEEGFEFGGEGESEDEGASEEGESDEEEEEEEEAAPAASLQQKQAAAKANGKKGKGAGLPQQDVAKGQEQGVQRRMESSDANPRTNGRGGQVKQQAPAVKREVEAKAAKHGRGGPASSQREQGAAGARGSGGAKEGAKGRGRGGARGGRGGARGGRGGRGRGRA